MANCSPNLSTRFGFGQRTNLGGRPALSPALRQIQSLSKSEVCKLISKIARMTRSEIQLLIEDEKTAMVELSIARIFVRAIKDCDVGRISFLLDRSIGRASAVELEDEVSDPRDELKKLSMGELVGLVRDNIPEIFNKEISNGFDITQPHVKSK